MQPLVELQMVGFIIMEQSPVPLQLPGVQVHPATEAQVFSSEKALQAMAGSQTPPQVQPSWPSHAFCVPRFSQAVQVPVQEKAALS